MQHEVAYCDGAGPGHRRARFPIPLGDPHLFTATPRWLDYLAGDELSLREATASFLFQSRRLDQAVAAMTPWIHVPTYLALAGHDRIIDNARSEAWFARLGTQDRTIKRYETAHHTLEFEPEPQPIFADLATWLTARMQGRGSDRAEGWVPRV